MNGHNHPPRCCCESRPGGAMVITCPVCPQHGELARLSQRPAAEPVCPHCGAVGDEPHGDCSSGKGMEARRHASGRTVRRDRDVNTLRDDLVGRLAELRQMAADGGNLLALDSTITELQDMLDHHPAGPADALNWARSQVGKPYDVAGTSLRLTHDAYKPYDVVRNWHTEVHTGRLEGCQEQPCHAVAKLGDR